MPSVSKELITLDQVWSPPVYSFPASSLAPLEIPITIKKGLIKLMIYLFIGYIKLVIYDHKRILMLWATGRMVWWYTEILPNWTESDKDAEWHNG